MEPVAGHSAVAGERVAHSLSPEEISFQQLMKAVLPKRLGPALRSIRPVLGQHAAFGVQHKQGHTEIAVGTHNAEIVQTPPSLPAAARPPITPATTRPPI